MTFLSKSKYLAGLQCHKLLWFHYNAKEEIPPPDEATQAIFEQGHEVGELAKRLFPGGVEVARGIIDFDQVVRQSGEAIRLRKPMFEAAFRYKNAYARADILNPAGKDQWDIIEVKSSTEVKEINLHDLAIQKYTYEGAGLKVRKCSILHINKEYLRRGEIDPEKLFVLEDMTSEASLLLSGVEENLKRMVRTISARKHPDVPIGPYCSDPYECPLQEKCWAFLPEHNVFTLARLGQKGFALLESGVQEIVQIPDDFKLSNSQVIQLRAVKSGKPHIDGGAIKAFLDRLAYPLTFLDFETFGTAIPLFDLVRPYQQIPFQYSLHSIESEGTLPKHHSFLAHGREDPRGEILSQLKRLLGKSGSIVSYNAAFEKARLRECCKVFPEYEKWWEATEERVVDLLEPFRSFHYYHPDQRGSASIKAVLPVLVGQGYEGLAIADGTTASREFHRVTFGEAEPQDREKVRKQLEEYCGRDTKGMVEIVEALGRLVRAS